MKACSKEIQDFLQLVRNAIKCRNYTFIPREKNKTSMAKYGLLVDDVIDTISNLDEKNYHKGPEKDHDNEKNDYIWIFKKGIIGNIFYIKIKICEMDNMLIIISFHIDEAI